MSIQIIQIKHQKHPRLFPSESPTKCTTPIYHISPKRVWRLLDPIIRAREDATNGIRRVAVHDTLHRHVRADSEEEESHTDDEEIESQHSVSVETLLVQPPNAAINAAHADVRYAPEDESEEGVEER